MTRAPGPAGADAVVMMRAGKRDGGWESDLFEDARNNQPSVKPRVIVDSCV